MVCICSFQWLSFAVACLLQLGVNTTQPADSRVVEPLFDFDADARMIRSGASLQDRAAAHKRINYDLATVPQEAFNGATGFSAGWTRFAAGTGLNRRMSA